MTNYDFIATAISHWHAIGVDAFIYDLSIKLNRKPKGKIIINPHHVDGFVINKKDFVCNKYADVKFYLGEEITQDEPSFFKNIANFPVKIFKNLQKKTNSKKDNYIYLVFPMEPSVNIIKKTIEEYDDRYPYVILVDEGVGTYFSSKMVKKVSKIYKSSEEASYSTFDKLKLDILKFIGSIGRKILLKNITVEKRFLFKKSGELVVNKAIAKSYRKVFDYRRKDLGISGDNIIILLTEAFAEYNQIPFDDEVSLIEEAIKSLEGYTVVLKSHPRETPGKYERLKKYGIKEIPLDFPVEDIFSTVNPIGVVGFLSTALLNAKLFYDITVISMADILVDYSDTDLNRLQAKEFKDLTGDFINFINDVEDIRHLIKSEG